MGLALRLLSIQSLGKKSREFLQEHPNAKRIMGVPIYFHFLCYWIIGLLYYVFGLEVKYILDTYPFLSAVIVFGPLLTLSFGSSILMHFTKQKNKDEPAFPITSAAFIGSRFFMYLDLFATAFGGFLLANILLVGLGMVLGPVIPVSISGILFFILIFIAFPMVANTVADEDITHDDARPLIKRVLKKRGVEYVYARILFKIMWAIMNALMFLPLYYVHLIGWTLNSSFFIFTVIMILSAVINTWFYTLLGIFQSNTYDLAKEEIHKEMREEDILYLEEEKLALDSDAYIDEDIVSLDLNEKRDTFLGLDLDIDDEENNKGIW